VNNYRPSLRRHGPGLYQDADEKRLIIVTVGTGMRLHPIWKNLRVVFRRADVGMLGISTIQAALATLCRRAGVDVSFNG